MNMSTGSEVFCLSSFIVAEHNHWDITRWSDGIDTRKKGRLVLKLKKLLA